MRRTTYRWRHRQYGCDEGTRKREDSRVQELVRMRGKQSYQKKKKWYL